MHIASPLLLITKSPQRVRVCNVCCFMYIYIYAHAYIYFIHLFIYIYVYVYNDMHVRVSCNVTVYHRVSM